MFHTKRDHTIKANAQLAHLQALTHEPIIQLAKEPFFADAQYELE